MKQTPLHRAIEAAGSQAAIATIVGVTQQAVSSRAKNGSEVPAKWAVKIEAALGISRHDLCPDIFGPAPAAKRAGPAQPAGRRAA